MGKIYDKDDDLDLGKSLNEVPKEVYECEEDEVPQGSAKLRIVYFPLNKVTRIQDGYNI
jgi:hypothetical protein